MMIITMIHQTSTRTSGDVGTLRHVKKSRAIEYLIVSYMSVTYEMFVLKMYCICLFVFCDTDAGAEWKNGCRRVVAHGRDSMNHCVLARGAGASIYWMITQRLHLSLDQWIPLKDLTNGWTVAGNLIHPLLKHWTFTKCLISLPEWWWKTKKSVYAT